MEIGDANSLVKAQIIWFKKYLLKEEQPQLRYTYRVETQKEKRKKFFKSRDKTILIDAQNKPRRRNTSMRI